MVTTKGLSTMRARERRKVRVPQAVFALLLFSDSCRRENFAAAMPGVMATHFGASGSANGWQTKGQFFVLRICNARRLPSDRLRRPRNNLPPLRPRSSISPTKISGSHPSAAITLLAVFRIQMAWFACALITFLIVVNQLICKANQSIPRHLNGPQFTMALVAFLGFVAIWTIRLISYFSNTPS